MNVKDYMINLGQQARVASRQISMATTVQKNDALNSIADHIEQAAQAIIVENKKDLDAGKQNGLDAALLDRLELNQQRISAMAEGCRQVAELPDPVGEITDKQQRPTGIDIAKMRVPLGVIGIIYESRPNVTIDAAALCLKSGNATILRGGSEAIHSNLAIASCIKQGLQETGLPLDIIQVVETTDRDAVGQLISMPNYVDVIVPRGGKSLIERISKQATVPVIKHLDGICHVYIDRDADVAMATEIAYNAKTHRYGVCNAMETLLVHEDIAEKVLPDLCQRYRDKDVELRGCEQTVALLSGIEKALPDDWDTEYLAPILSIRIVDDVNQAMLHIADHGSDHTECIVTNNQETAELFLRSVDASSVMHNASTRFADGFEYGLGAEIGISTDKLHVRGPVGLEGLTSQKYVVYGNGQIRQ